MKVFKNIILCIIISLIIQFSGLFYLNNYFLTSNGDVKSLKVVDPNNKTSVSQINIPNNAKAINVSYNAGYISYFLNDELYVINTITGQSVNVSLSNGIKISFYKWLPDRNRILIAQTENRSLYLSYYDAAEMKKGNITDLLMVSSASKVKDIEAAPLPNVIYIKVSNSNENNSIYWVNIMESKKKIITETKNIGNIKAAPLEDKMVYEDLTNGKIYVTGINNALSFHGSARLRLLGIGDNDQVYIGNADSSNNIDKIYFGSFTDDTLNWQTLKLSTPIGKENIFVSDSGNVYINDNLKGTIKEPQTGKETFYKGKFLRLYIDGIASINDGILVKTSFN
jgi:hypothetical protein